MKSKVGLTIFLALAVGMGVAVWDWRQWRIEETKNYGHGPGGDVELKVENPKVYQNNEVGLRMRVPGNWTWVESAQGVRFSSDMVMSTVQNGMSAVDAANARVAKMGKLAKEREYVVTDYVNAVVLTWKTGTGFVQELLTDGDGVIIILRTEKVGLREADWGEVEKVLKGVYRTIVIF